MFKRKRGLIVVVIVGVLLLANFYSPLRIRRVSIRLAPELVFRLGRLAVTNTLLCSWLATLVLLVLALLATRRLVDLPEPLSLQNAVEVVFEALYGFAQTFARTKTRAVFPVVATFFLFILTSNWLGLLPGFGSIGFWEVHEGQRAFVPLLRGATTDLNTTLALALCSVISAQVYGLRHLGVFEYGSRFVAVGKFAAFFGALVRGQRPRFSLFLRGILDLFLGVLEILGELTKVLSFSFRLFGNIFGGEVLLLVMAFLVPYVAAIPFIALELFGGLIQAFIFAVLTTVFLGRAITEHDRTETEDEGDGGMVASRQSIEPKPGERSLDAWKSAGT